MSTLRQTEPADQAKADREEKPARRPRQRGALRAQRYARIAFLVPAMAYVAFAFVVPALYNLVLSFEETSPATIANLFAPFAGLANYRAVLFDATTQLALVNTAVFTAGSLFFQFIIGFSMALLFNLKFPFKNFARSLIIVPWLLPLIVTGIIFQFLFRLQAGAVNEILMMLGIIDDPVGFLLSPRLAFLVILITNIWIGIPFFAVLLYSALQEIPAELTEAATIDGANAWQRLTRVTIPVIRPVIEVVLTLGFVFTVKVFDIVIGTTQGGPANSTQLLATWAYNLSFQQFEYGQGAALNTILLVIALFAAPVYLWLNRESLRVGSR